MTGRRAGAVGLRPRAAALAAVGAAAAGWPAAAQALTPIAPQDVATGDFIGSVAAAAGPQGQATALWTGQNNNPTLLATQRPAGGPSGAAQIIDRQANVTQPGVAFGPDASQVAVWTHATTTETGGFSVAPAGGAFETARPFLAPNSAGFNHDLAMDASGRAMTVWAGDNAGTTFQPRVAIFPIPNQSFSGSFNVGGETAFAATFTPHVAASPSGEVVAIWARQITAGPLFGVRAAFGTTSSFTLGTPVTISATSATSDFGLSDVAIGPAGHAAAVWRQTVGGVATVKAAFRDPGGAFGAPVDVAGGPGSPADRPTVAVDAAGTATIAWVEGTGAAAVARSATRAAGAGVGAAQTVSDAGIRSSGLLDLDLDASGGATLGWLRTSGATFALEVARKAAGGQFGAPAAVTGDATAFATAIEPGGNVFAAWTAPVSPTVDVLRVGGLDTDAPPVLASVDVPALAAIGSAAAFAVEASDWSGLGQITWDFGDGATAAGARASHAYAAAGDYTVTVRVPDRAGNVATATRRVVVPAASLAQLGDRTAPRLPVFAPPKRITRARLLRAGVSVRLRSDEAAAATVELLASFNGRTLAGRSPNLVLATRRVNLVPGSAVGVRLRPRAALVGTRAFRATVRITLRDAAGNTRVATKVVSVTVPTRRR